MATLWVSMWKRMLSKFLIFGLLIANVSFFSPLFPWNKCLIFIKICKESSDLDTIPSTTKLLILDSIIISREFGFPPNFACLYTEILRLFFFFFCVCVCVGNQSSIEKKYQRIQEHKKKQSQKMKNKSQN